MPFDEDLGEFLDTDEFATAATYTPAGGSAKTVNGIFDARYFEALGIDGTQPAFTCVASDVPDAARGDALVIDSVDYKVSGVEPDGTGLTVLRLEKQ
jgi:hypothetical protein